MPRSFLSLRKTCQNNAISFSTYLGDRLGIAANSVDRLPASFDAIPPTSEPDS
jgi:hypothetical protein